MRLANRPAEVVALKERYDLSMKDAEGRGALPVAQRFDSAMKRSVPVINVDIYFLRGFISGDGALYATYHQGVRAETRKAALLENDRERLGVDGIMFGQMGAHIVTAALSLECRGLRSYGDYCMQLRDVAIAKRASLLEENSFLFVQRHRILPGGAIPPGHTADWPTRHMLASAKLLAKVNASTTDSDFQGLLLQSTGVRRTDDFVEIHIYQGFDNKAVERVSGPIPQDPIDVAMWAVVRELMTKAGKESEEY